MRTSRFSAAVAALVLTLAAAPAAFATPERRICTDCHSLDPAVTVRASFLGCSGGNATYSVSVSDTHANGEGWAVFNGTTNTVNGFSPASSQFTVAAGRSYTVRGVSDGANRGGSAAVTISPVCNACTPAVEACDDGIDNDCDGVVDCRDSNCSADPACVTCSPAPELCADGVDNDCDGLTDCGDGDCGGDLACTGGCTPTGRSERRRCADGVDNDCDGLADCLDRDCRKNAACR